MHGAESHHDVGAPALIAGRRTPRRYVECKRLNPACGAAMEAKREIAHPPGDQR